MPFTGNKAVALADKSPLASFNFEITRPLRKSSGH